MSRTRASTLIAISLGLMLAAACTDSTGPGADRPGTLLLASRTFGEYTWLPSGNEILFGTQATYPFPGRGGRIEVIKVPDGARRTIATAPSAGLEVLPFGFDVQGSNLYFAVVHATSHRRTIHRAPLSGAGAPEVVMDSAPAGPFAVSPDERSLAWVDLDQPSNDATLVVTDIASGARRMYPLGHYARSMEWSPSGRSILVRDGDQYGVHGLFHLVDLATGPVGMLVPRDLMMRRIFNEIRWKDEVPWLYTNAHEGRLARFSIPAGVGDTLMRGLSLTGNIQWSADLETVVVATAECARWRGSITSRCVEWANTIEHVRAASGERLNVFRFKGGEVVLAKPSPNSEWLAYFHHSCPRACNAAGDGLYVARLR